MVAGFHRRVLVVGFVDASLLVAAAGALAAGAIKNATYSGTFKAGAPPVTITFKVSKNGTKVTKLHASNTGLYCSGGGPPTPVDFKDASISRAGKFNSTGVYVIKVGPLKGKVGMRLKITGTFKSGGRESGTMTTTYVNAKSCSGTSSYTTKAARG